MSDERGRGAADDERAEAAEPAVGSAEWLLQQLTGGRRVAREEGRPQREEPEAEHPPVVEHAPVAEQPPVPDQPLPPSTPPPSGESGFDDLLGSFLEEPTAVEEAPTEFPVAFTWNLTPGAGADPLVESTSAEDDDAQEAERVPGPSEDIPLPVPAPLLPPQPPVAPPLVPPVNRAPVVEPAATEPPPVFEPPVVEPPVFEPPVVEPPVFEPPAVESPVEEEPSQEAPEEPRAARSWVIQQSEPEAPVEAEKPRTIFDSPVTEVPDEEDTSAGHGLAALLGFGPSEPDKPSSHSVIGDTTSIIPLDPSALTRPPAPPAPPEAVAPPPTPPQQPVLPPLDAAALLEPGVDSPTQRLDATEIAALLRAGRDDRPPVLPSEPELPAAQAELALGGVPSPATSPIDAESIAAASEPEPFEPWTVDGSGAAGEPAAPLSVGDEVAAAGDDDEPDGIAALFGDVVAEEPEDADDYATEPGEREAEAEVAPGPAAEAEGPQLLATAPFTMPPADARTFSAPADAPASSAPADSSMAPTEMFVPFPSASAVPAGPPAPSGPLPPSGPTRTRTAAPAGPGGWDSRNKRILFSVAGALAVVLVLIGLFALGTRIPSLFGASQPLPLSTASGTASARPKATPTPTPTPTVTPKPAAAVGPGAHPWYTLGGGECIQPFTTVWAQDFTVVDCATPHTAQLVYTNLLSADPAAPYPGVDALAQQIPALCTAGGVIDLGAAAAYPDLQVVGSYPATEQQWKDGQRSYYCFADRSGGEPLTSSVAGPGPAA